MVQFWGHPGEATTINTTVRYSKEFIDTLFLITRIKIVDSYSPRHICGEILGTSPRLIAKKCAEFQKLTMALKFQKMSDCDPGPDRLGRLGLYRIFNRACHKKAVYRA